MSSKPAYLGRMTIMPRAFDSFYDAVSDTLLAYNCSKGGLRLSQGRRGVQFICLAQRIILSILLCSVVLPVEAAPSSSASALTNMRKRAEEITIPTRVKTLQNTSIPTISVYFPIPEVSDRWAALVSTLYMAADDLFETDPNLWVDIRVSRILNRSDAFEESEDAARSGGVAGFLGDAMYAEVAQVAARFQIPMCEGMDTRSQLSDRGKYPTLFRTIPSAESELAAMYSLVRYLGFSKVAIVPADNDTDSSSVFIMASKYNLSVQAMYLEPETATGCARIEQSLRANTAADALVVVLILSKHFAATCLESLAANANLAKKATWVLDQAAMSVVSSVKASGMFAVSRIEGSGEAYANVLSKWRDPAYQSRYPHISAFDVPPAGFMFVRSCLEVMINGFNQKLSQSGLQSVVSRQMNVPADFTFPSLETSTGRIDFRPGTADRAGSFNIHYHNGTSFVLVGVLNESMQIDLRQSLDTFGWVNASVPSVAVGESGRSNASLATGLSVGGGILIIGLAVYIYYRCRAARSDLNKSTEEEEEVGLQSNANNIGINVSGTGQQALNILARMKEQDQKRNRPCLTDFQIQILTDALTSGGNSAYDPTFELSPTNGPPVDAELQEFLMNTMLATGKRRTAVDGHLIPVSTATLNAAPPSTPIPLQDDEPPGLTREKSLFKQLKSSAHSLVSNRLHDAEAGTREGSEAASPEGPHFKSDRTEELKHASAAKFAMKREFSNESYLLAGTVARSKTTKAGALKSLNSQQPSLARRISTFATHAFSPAGMTQSPVKDSMEPKEFAMSPLSSSVFIAVPDLNRPYFESKFMQNATEDLQTISMSPINDYLNSACLTWGIDMFKLCDLSEGHPLYFSGMWIVEKTDFLDRYRIGTGKFKSWLLMMEREYSPLPYHNRLHAADVLQGFNYMAFHGQWASAFTPIEKFAGLLAAIGHDIDHTGFSNQFLVKSRHPMAIMYSDSSVNEFHHSAHMFTTTLESESNIFSGFTVEEFEEMRRIVIKLIVATDMGKHFEIMSKFQTKMAATGFAKLDTQENRLLVLEIALKCSDLSNPSKPQDIAVQWSFCIMEEFYRQGDEERKHGLPVSNFMDRQNPNVAKCQIGFIDLLVAPLFNTWISFNRDDDANNATMRSNISHNKKLWQHVSASSKQESGSARSNAVSLIAKSLSSIDPSAVVTTSMSNGRGGTPEVPQVPEIFVMQASERSIPVLE
ncbi:hypothetical protein CcCBS67573_g03449 [Chytriomyces confervae]|uniref:Phosphodiesterase n=1 Tax=Chytriomyces confervae TaxID=246404 RepID=A0A507FGJ7_9FUNG|nr:hypothetical protein CcCBS67573_g03449 [Chytriomyces confervae]